MRNRLIWLLILVFVAVPLCYLIFLWHDFRSEKTINSMINENSPQIMFKSIIADPIPQEITNLEGATLYWQGYITYFRFNATDKFTSKLLKNHNEIPCDSIDIVKYLEKNKAMENHLNFWTIDKVKNPTCYKSIESYKNKATHSGSDVILLDKENNVVYFSGLGC